MKLNGLLLVYVYQIYAFNCAKVLPRFLLRVRSGLQKKSVVERCMLVTGASYRKYGKKTLEPTDAPVRLFSGSPKHPFYTLLAMFPRGHALFTRERVMGLDGQYLTIVGRVLAKYRD